MKVQRFLSLSDIHVPNTDKEAFYWACQQIADFKPDVVVLNGDLFEADAASRWPSEAEHDLLDEFIEAARVLEDIREAGEGANLVFLPGNHDANIVAPNRISRKLRRSTDYKQNRFVADALKHWRHDFQYISLPKLCTYRLGQVTFMHGFKSNASSDKSEALQYGDEWGLLVRGHTHRPCEVTRVRHYSTPLNRWYANSGCLVGIDPPPEYVQRKDTQEWGQAIVKGEAAIELKSPRVGRYWEAETVIRRLAWDDGTPWRSKLGELRDVPKADTPTNREPSGRGATRSRTHGRAGLVG